MTAKVKVPAKVKDQTEENPIEILESGETQASEIQVPPREGYTAKVNIKRNGVIYSPGERIMIDDESAMILLADGSIE